MDETQATALKDLNQGALSVIQEATGNGAAMQKLTMQRKSSLIDLQNSGRCKPATVINFNPVGLQLHDGNVRFTVPSVQDKIKREITVDHAGKKLKATYVTVANPQFVAWIRDVNKPNPEAGEENPNADYDPVWILPIELADQFRIEYTDPARSPMGGLLVFEGEVEALRRPTLRIPKYTILPNRRRSYFTAEVDRNEYIASMLTQQKNYCQMAIQQGDTYNQNEQEARNIGPVHRAWAQFALDMGWKQQSPPWMNATLDSEESCKGCGRGKTRSDAHYCVCGRPFNPFASFMLGENIPESYLFALKGDELDKAMKELARRAKLKKQYEDAMKS